MRRKFCDQLPQLSSWRRQNLAAQPGCSAMAGMLDLNMDGVVPGCESHCWVFVLFGKKEEVRAVRL
jgi:hypothetical protein